MDRILILGCPGAGKSTLARQLSDILNLPVIHLDQEYWQPGWVETPADEWRQRVATLAQRERWVMDGNYGSTLEMRLERADAVIYLDYPRWRCLWRIMKRVRRYRGVTRPDMGFDCQERLDWDFVKFVWGFKKRGRLRNYRMLRDNGMIDRTVVLKRPGETKTFLKQTQAGRSIK